MRPYTELPSNTCHKFLQTKTLGKLPKVPSTQLRIKQRTATRNQGTKGQESWNFIIGISLMVSSCRNRVLHQKEYLLLKLSSQEKIKSKRDTIYIYIYIYTHTYTHINTLSCGTILGISPPKMAFSQPQAIQAMTKRTLRVISPTKDKG